MEGAHRGAGVVGGAGLQLSGGGGAGRLPFVPQRFDHGGQHQPLHIGPRRVMRAEFMPLRRVQGALQQRAEDRRLHPGPICLRRFPQQRHPVGGQRQGAAIFEQRPVEVPDPPAGHAGIFGALVHIRPEALRGVREDGGVRFAAFQQRGEGGRRQQTGVFAEHGEQAAHQEPGDLRGRSGGVRAVALLQPLRQLRQFGGQFPGGPGAAFGRVQRRRVRPDGLEDRPHVRVGQIVQPHAVGATPGPDLRERPVMLAGAGEVRIEVQTVADVADD
ncbi:hypothetical protein LzC2_34180 [Planctomycetes bacterium LzC2]|uniref:Uncharacterized protein n=1 Tax=Alienimonas chondri TaxID=2681879 RepID=A0ABX1VKW1_9PLAN|nr:hypothetical protein [Alienimonas chondri]